MSRTPFHALHSSVTRVALLCLTALTGATLSSAQAQGWPQRPIKLVVPASAGGTVDLLTRAMSGKLGELLAAMGKGGKPAQPSASEH